MQNTAISRCCFVTFGKQRQRNEHRIIAHAYTAIVLVAVAVRRLEIVFIFPRLVLQILFQIQFGLSYQCEIYHRHK